MKMKKAQTLIEFTAVFAIFLAIVFVCIDHGLYMRAKWQIETVTNEVMTNTQLSSDSASCENSAKNEFEKRLSLVYPSKITFNCNNLNEIYECQSEETTGTEPKFKFKINCSDMPKLSLYLEYNYVGFFVYSRPQTIISAINSATPKF